MEKWKPRDCFGIVVVLGALGLLFSGIDTFVGWALVVVVAAYYGIDLSPIFKVGRNQKKKEDN